MPEETTPVEETQVEVEEEAPVDETAITEDGHDAPQIDDVSLGAMFDDESDPEPEPEPPKGDEAPPGEEPAPETPPETLEAPQHWAEPDKETFNSLPRESQDFLLRRHKEMEGDYTRGKQGLAEEARAIEGLKPLGEALRRDPDLRDYLKNYKQSEAETSTEETDPIEQIKKEAAETAYQRIKKEQEAEKATSVRENLESTLKEHQADENYEQVMGELWKFVKAQDEELQPSIFQRLDQDPKYFSKKFKEVKATLLKPKENPPEKDALKPRKETVHTPNLQDPGADTAESAAKTKRKKRDDIIKRVEQGSIRAIGEMFDPL